MKKSIVCLSVLFASASLLDAQASSLELNAWPVEPAWPVEFVETPSWPLDVELSAWPADSETAVWPVGEELSVWPEK